MSQISGNYPDLVPHFGVNHDFDQDLNKSNSTPPPLDAPFGTSSFLSAPFGSAPPPPASTLSAPFGATVEPTPAAVRNDFAAVQRAETVKAIPSPPLEKEVTLPAPIVPQPAAAHVPRVATKPTTPKFTNPIYKDFAPTDETVFDETVEEFAESVLLFARAYGLAPRTTKDSSTKAARVPKGFEQLGGRVVPFGMSIFPSTNYNFNVNSGNTTNVTNNGLNFSRSKKDKEQEERKRRQVWRATLGVAAIIGVPVLAYITGSQVSILLYIGSVEHNRKVAEKVVLRALELEASSEVNPDVRLVSRTIKAWERGARPLRKHNIMSLSFKFGTLVGAGAALAGFIREEDNLTTSGGVAALVFLSLGLFEYARFSFRRNEVEANITKAAAHAEVILNKKEAHSFNPKQSVNPEFSS